MDKIYDEFSANLIDKLIAIEGYATYSKAGPCLKIKNDIIFIPDIFEWESKYENKQIIITGIVIQKKIIPDVKIEANGAISQGAFGNQLIFKEIKDIKINP
ncbi:MAG: hypothetical protein FK734_11475 [Asgard group archaeon]|nr:hypothetical protein [Asgard group archaeon]